MSDDLRSARLPVSLDVFNDEVARRKDEIAELLDAGRRLVEAVERLVCSLYYLPADLTELVIESAITRAGTIATNED